MKEKARYWINKRWRTQEADQGIYRHKPVHKDQVHAKEKRCKDNHMNEKRTVPIRPAAESTVRKDKSKQQHGRTICKRCQESNRAYPKNIRLRKDSWRIETRTRQFKTLTRVLFWRKEPGKGSGAAGYIPSKEDLQKFQQRPSSFLYQKARGSGATLTECT